MTAVAIESHAWTWRRWCLLIALTLIVQLGLIFSLGNKSPPRSRMPSPAPKLSLVENSSSELIALTDPTLFALPHRIGFSGPAWMKIPPVPSHAFEWTEPPHWLPFPTEQFGTRAASVLDTSQIELLTTLVPFEPEPTSSEPIFTGSFRQKSELRLADGLERRTLKTSPMLPSWPNSDFVTNTVVKLFVNGDGISVSIPILLSSSGLKAADDYALSQASVARFVPIRNEGPNRSTNPLVNATWGTMIFEWHTLPLSATNAGTPNPQ